jgi:type 9 secretion system plug protein
MKYFIFCFLCFSFYVSGAQIPDHIFKPNIRSVTLTKVGDIYSYPIMNLNSADAFELHFDDLDGDVKTYYYTIVLCNADWTPANLTPFDYIRGFQNVRITNYRTSSIAFTRYTHYQVFFPDRNFIPTRSGNYILKVFIEGDTSKLVLTKRFLVVDNKAAIVAQVQQPFNQKWFYTYQKVVVHVTLNNTINVFNQQDAKVVILQNYTWTNAAYVTRPNIFRGNYFEYYDENTNSFPGGKEWRWIDLRSLRLMSDRMQKLDKKGNVTEVYVKPDGDRLNQPYLYYRDLNGIFTIENIDNVNPYWQGDYARVHFSYFPPGNRPYEGKSVYLYGALTNYTPSDSSKLIFNPDRGAYEKTLFLKQGYYNYSYITVPDKPTGEIFSFENTEGNYWGTENAYMVLVYYRAFGSRADELIGYTTLNSIFQRTGAGY